MRAIFVAADLWARAHVAPPPSTLLKRTQQDPDPVYGFFTGIARDGDSNASGGVRLPDVAVGRAQFIAADLTALPGIFGATVDLSCEPRPRSPHDGPRFESHRDYVRQFAKQLLVLRQHRFVLPDDAMKLLDDAIQSDVGVCP